jgi:hypothetical protein
LDYLAFEDGTDVPKRRYVTTNLHYVTFRRAEISFTPGGGLKSRIAFLCYLSQMSRR